MGFENHEFEQANEQEQGPSWQRSNWRLADSDDLTRALDPTAMAVEIKAAAKTAGKPVSDTDAVSAAGDSIRAMMLVRTYRVRGHLAANLDPLGLSKQDMAWRVWTTNPRRHLDRALRSISERSDISARQQVICQQPRA